MQSLQIRLTGKTGKIDGYAEIILGVFAISQLLVSHKMGVKRRPHGITQIYMDLVLRDAPLGNMGESDLPDYKGENE